MSDDLEDIGQLELHVGQRGRVQPGKRVQALVEGGLDASGHVADAVDNIRGNNFVCEDKAHIVRKEVMYYKSKKKKKKRKCSQ